MSVNLNGRLRLTLIHLFQYRLEGDRSRLDPIEASFHLESGLPWEVLRDAERLCALYRWPICPKGNSGVCTNV
ncbi:MAG: hypothetical protein Ct9H90mP16_08890 [Candidatus Poseidoniales archaeon]|nr:MAG: hypothetical protein Ct9H90mP16_08890 [Candidatus Poseidoniales archaeon]